MRQCNKSAQRSVLKQFGFFPTGAFYRGKLCLTLWHLQFQLLTVKPEHRFTSLTDIQTFSSLSAVDWDEICDKKVEPGFVPNVSNIM